MMKTTASLPLYFVKLIFYPHWNILLAFIILCSVPHGQNSACVYILSPMKQIPFFLTANKNVKCISQGCQCRLIIKKKEMSKRREQSDRSIAPHGRGSRGPLKCLPLVGVQRPLKLLDLSILIPLESHSGAPNPEEEKMGGKINKK